MPGANVTSRADCDDISRGKRRFDNHDLHARAEPARNRGEESAGLEFAKARATIFFYGRPFHPAAYGDQAA